MEISKKREKTNLYKMKKNFNRRRERYVIIINLLLIYFSKYIDPYSS